MRSAQREGRYKTPPWVAENHPQRRRVEARNGRSELLPWRHPQGFPSCCQTAAIVILLMLAGLSLAQADSETMYERERQHGFMWVRE